MRRRRRSKKTDGVIPAFVVYLPGLLVQEEQTLAAEVYENRSIDFWTLGNVLGKLTCDGQAAESPEKRI